MLESNHGLDVDKDAHIWLLHFLFLGYINIDADAWMRAWNMHTLSRQGDRHLSDEQHRVWILTSRRQSIRAQR